MKRFPSTPRVADASDQLLEEGHLWLLEHVDGADFRFQLQQSGLIRFGDDERVYDDPTAVPEPYQHAVRHVQETLDRDALRRAVDDVEDVVFFGKSMQHQRIEYDWERTPSFLGCDVWSADQETFRSPDAAEQIFERLGLDPINAFERERRARDFDPGSYTIPQSAWYDGPAAGVVIRDKQGHRAKLLHPDFRGDEQANPTDVEDDVSAAELAAEYATQRRFETIITDLEKRGRSVTFEALYERVLEEIVREAHNRLDDAPVDMSAFRSEVAARTQTFLDDR